MGLRQGPRQRNLSHEGIPLEFIAHSGAQLGAPNAYSLIGDAGHILLDCGAPTKILDALPRPDLVWVSHAHGDHCAGLPDLFQRWPDVPLYTSEPTARLLSFALESPAIARKARPLPFRAFHRPRALPGLRLLAIEAGHVAGAALLVVEAHDPSRPEPFRALYTGDFCTHDQLSLPGAGLPVLDGPLDLLITETVLAADADADALDYDAEAARAIGLLNDAPGPCLIGVHSLGQSAEATAIVQRSRRPLLIDEYLKPVLIAHPYPQAFPHPLRFGSRRQLRQHLDTDGAVIAPGDQLRPHTAAAHLAEPLLENPHATIFLTGRARPRTGAGRLLAAASSPDRSLRWSRRDLQLRAHVHHLNLLNHAPRWQLQAFLQGLQPHTTHLVHGTTGARWALKRAVEKMGYNHEIVVA